MSARTLMLVAALAVAAPSVARAQSRDLKFTGPVIVGDGGVSVGQFKVMNPDLAKLLKSAGGRSVYIEGTKNSDTEVTITKLSGYNWDVKSATNLPKILKEPRDGAAAGDDVELGSKVSITGTTEDGQWLKVLDRDGNPGFVKAAPFSLGMQLRGPGEIELQGKVTVENGAVKVDGVKVLNPNFANLLKSAAGKDVIVKATLPRHDAEDGTVLGVNVTAVSGMNMNKANEPKLFASPTEESYFKGQVGFGSMVSIIGKKDGFFEVAFTPPNGTRYEKAFVKCEELTVGAPSQTAGFGAKLDFGKH